MPPDFEEGLLTALSDYTKDGARTEKMIRLRYEEGLTLEQIGKEIGINSERVRYLIRYSQRRLREKEYRTLCEKGYAAWQEELRANAERETKPLTDPAQVSIFRLSELGLSFTQIRALENIGIQSLKDLQETPDSKLLELKRINLWTIKQLRGLQEQMEELLTAGAITAERLETSIN